MKWLYQKISCIKLYFETFINFQGSNMFSDVTVAMSIFLCISSPMKTLSISINCLTYIFMMFIVVHLPWVALSWYFLFIELCMMTNLTKTTFCFSVVWWRNWTTWRRTPWEMEQLSVSCVGMSLVCWGLAPLTVMTAKM